MKKRNLFIGIALVAVILISVYVANYGGILEGNTSQTSTTNPVALATKPVVYKETTYNPPADVLNALQTIEEILNGKMKMDGNGSNIYYEEYKLDLKNNPYKKGKDDKLVNYNFPTIKDKLTLSYNDTIQTIYAFTKKIVSDTRDPDLPPATSDPLILQYIINYSAFISKLNKNIDTVLKDNSNTDGKKLLSLILSANSFTFIDEKTKEEKNIGVRSTNDALYTVGFEETILIMHNCFHVIYTRSALNKPPDYFLSNYSEWPKSSVSILQKNYNTLNLNFKQLKSVPSIPVSNTTDRALPIFVGLIANYTNPNTDVTDNKIFNAYKIVFDLPTLSTYIISRNKTQKPGWFTEQNPASATIILPK